jgi:hypothetical protein
MLQMTSMAFALSSGIKISLGSSLFDSDLLAVRTCYEADVAGFSDLCSRGHSVIGAVSCYITGQGSGCVLHIASIAGALEDFVCHAFHR